jgi:hypothetical protein
MEKIVIEERQSGAMRLTAAGLLMLIVSIAIWYLGMKEKRILIWLIGFLSSVFFGIRFLILLGRTLESKPLITITFDGIIDSSSGSSVGYIPFQDIDHFIIMEQKEIGIIPKDIEQFINKLSPMKQKVALVNVKAKNPPLILRADRAKDMSLEDIFTLLKKRLDDYRSLYD